MKSLPRPFGLSSPRGQKEANRFLPSIEALESRELPAAGLMGFYYDNQNLTGSPKAELATTAGVDYNWIPGGAKLPAGIPAHSYSVVWEGDVTIPKDAIYKFWTETDDGVRLYLDGKLVINDWEDHAPKKDFTDGIELKAGTKHQILMTYYENSYGYASASLHWVGSDEKGQVVVPDTIVPQADLSHSETQQVTLKNVTIKQYYDQYANDPKMQETIKTILANFFATKLDDVEKFGWLVKVRDWPNRADYIQGNLLYNILFEDPNAKGSIVQQVTQTTTIYNMEGKPSQSVTNYRVEGWSVQNGAASRFDTHEVFDFPVNVKRYSRTEVVVKFTVGDGLIDGKLVAGSYHRTPITEDKKTLDSATFIGKTRTYELKFVVNNDGTWTFKDTGLGIDVTGKFGKITKP